ncbi:carboxylating nicotinate-nucleotide diphosphorylase [Glaciecola sp. MH2013]|uniref:carboxylating nicotinate-nucleotide diphosphorylase n=1 Tax=Glaciecola sp. MH2013 TaxID=2785524 RepID=UPI00189FE75C|nr:carboxylating nicotinate-nucleotide diphosphorylase [Glaciecola sp. MH2013]MBF7072064.1 carboxylating nicotinate-nucleotide diphosphorylase [Glaciecola sp. MH2013]
MSLISEYKLNIPYQVNQALAEDLGFDFVPSSSQPQAETLAISQRELDITAMLINEDEVMHAQIITREAAVICGVEWVNEVFQQVDSSVELHWQCKDGDHVGAKQCLVTIHGNARSILTAERCALNFLQTLSGTATVTAKYASYLTGSKTKLLDTRKTLPGMRQAQKYAVACAGGQNHRMGLYDAYLIKENHIEACGGIKNAVTKARKLQPNAAIEVEVETLDELRQALNCNVNTIMLDNFSTKLVKEAVAITDGKCKIEVSGNITLARLQELAATGIDYISSGALTKHVSAIDLSLVSLQERRSSPDTK